MSETDLPTTAAYIFDNAVAPQLAQIKDEINTLFDSFIEQHLTEGLPRRDEFVAKVAQLRDAAVNNFQDGFEQGREMISDKTDLEAERFACVANKEFAKQFQIEINHLKTTLIELERKIELIWTVANSSVKAPNIH